MVPGPGWWVQIVTSGDLQSCLRSQWGVGICPNLSLRLEYDASEIRRFGGVFF